jgi:hypothetical protein
MKKGISQLCNAVSVMNQHYCQGSGVMVTGYDVGSSALLVVVRCMSWSAIFMLKGKVVRKIERLDVQDCMINAITMQVIAIFS